MQLRRADSCGDRFVPRFRRRLLALAVFGFIAEGFFGYNVLISYAIWGVPLLLVRRWSNRALVIALVLCAMSQSLYPVARATYLTAAGRPEQFEPAMKAERAHYRAVSQESVTASRSSDYPTVVAARIRFMPQFYSQPFSFLPGLSFTLFLIGLLALRLGLFEDPGRHRWLIIGCMIFGAASWTASEWLFPLSIKPSPTLPLPIRVIVTMATQLRFFALLRDRWLSFTYIGAILLLVAHNPAWLRWLSAFGITGRMALTNYMRQVIILDVTFSNYAFRAHVGAAYAPLAALALFGIEWAFSRWWLSRFQYGPLEWLWRGITYARWQPLRLTARAVGREPTSRSYSGWASRRPLVRGKIPFATSCTTSSSCLHWFARTSSGAARIRPRI